MSVLKAVANSGGSGSGGGSIPSTITGGTDGSVLFIHPANTLAQDNANFFYDSTNHRLGIGTITPNYQSTIIGLTTAGAQLYMGQVTSGSSFTGALLLDSTGNSRSPAIFFASEESTATTWGRIKWVFANTGNTNDSIFQINGRTLITDAVGGTTSGSPVFSVLGAFATEKIAVFTAGPSQTANLSEWQNNSGTAFVTVGPDTLTGASATSNFFNITGTLPSSLAAQTNGVNITITGAGSSNQNINALKCTLAAGYTGANLTATHICANNSAGTGTAYYDGVSGNFALYNSTISTTTGTNVASLNYASGGNINIGIFAETTVNKNSAINAAIVAVALNGGTSPTQCAGYFGLQAAAPTLSSAALIANNGATSSPIFKGQVAGTDTLVIGSTGLISTYKAISTAGWGVPAIYGYQRATGQTAAVTLSTGAITVGASDGSFDVCANVLVTTATTHAFTVTCAYTDEGNTARVLTLQFSSLAGAFVTSIANAGGAVPYEGVAVSIRAKSGTTITIASAAGGVYTSVVYNIEGFITQKS